MNMPYLTYAVWFIWGVISVIGFLTIVGGASLFRTYRGLRREQDFLDAQRVALGKLFANVKFQPGAFTAATLNSAVEGHAEQEKAWKESRVFQFIAQQIRLSQTGAFRAYAVRDIDLSGHDGMLRAARFLAGILVFLALLGTVTGLWLALKSLPTLSGGGQNMGAFDGMVQHMPLAFLSTMTGIGGTVLLNWGVHCCHARRARLQNDLDDLMLGVVIPRLYPAPEYALNARLDNAIAHLNAFNLRIKDANAKSDTSNTLLTALGSDYLKPLKDDSAAFRVGNEQIQTRLMESATKLAGIVLKVQEEAAAASMRTERAVRSAEEEITARAAVVAANFERATQQAAARMEQAAQENHAALQTAAAQTGITLQTIADRAGSALTAAAERTGDSLQATAERTENSLQDTARRTENSLQAAAVQTDEALRATAARTGTELETLTRVAAAKVEILGEAVTETAAVTLDSVARLHTDSRGLIDALARSGSDLGATLARVGDAVAAIPALLEATRSEQQEYRQTLRDLNFIQAEVRGDLQAVLSNWVGLGAQIAALEQQMQRSLQETLRRSEAASGQSAAEHGEFLKTLNQASAQLSSHLEDLKARETALHNAINSRISLALGSQDGTTPSPAERIALVLSDLEAELKRMTERIAAQTERLTPERATLPAAQAERQYSRRPPRRRPQSGVETASAAATLWAAPRDEFIPASAHLVAPDADAVFNLERSEAASDAPANASDVHTNASQEPPYAPNS